MPLAVRLELVADGFAYVAGGLIVLAILLLCALGALHLPLARPLGGYDVLFVPVGLFAAHVTSAALALRRRGLDGFRLLPSYHFTAMASTPVLFAGSLAAFVRVGRSHEGRVAKSARPARGMDAALVTTGLLGSATLAIAFWGTLPVPAAAWIGVFGAGFVTCAVAARAPATRA